MPIAATHSAPLNVRGDLALLRERLAVPAQVKSAIWVVIARGVSGGDAPGPTDTELWAFVAPAPGELAALAAGGRLLVPAEVARALLPADALAGAVEENGHLGIT